MSDRALIVLVASAAVASIGTWAARAWALRCNLLDSPNERSSHDVPIPRGAGVAIVAGVAFALALGVAEGMAPSWSLAALALSLPIAWLGWEDDKRGVSARARLTAQMLLAGVWIAYGAWRLEPAPSIWLASFAQIGPPAAGVIAILFVAWMANLHNFMDGIDGLAAVQAASVCTGAAAIAAFDVSQGVAPAALSTSFVWLAISAPCLGFLPWNWKPAKIFMGDVGSAFLGFLIAAFALRWEADRPGAATLIATLDAVFIVDATWTLIARATRKRRLSQAHRSHAYQIAARLFGSHAKVSWAVVAYNAMILMPLALLAAAGRVSPISAFLLGATPVGCVCAWLGAGQDERSGLRLESDAQTAVE